MPDEPIAPADPALVPAQSRPSETARLLRGAWRWLAAEGFEALPEFRPEKALRVDLFAIAPDGEIWVLEIKSGLADFQADAKWPRYRDWCDRFLFCVGPQFPKAVLPDDVGLVEADAFGAALLRAAPEHRLAPARRKALTLRAAREAAARLRRLADPGSEQAD